jgi:hypothetical protein
MECVTTAEAVPTECVPSSEGMTAAEAATMERMTSMKAATVETSSTCFCYVRDGNSQCQQQGSSQGTRGLPRLL